MKKDSSKFLMNIVVALLAVIYSVILFSAKSVFNITSWVGYGFTILAFLMVMFPMPGTQRYPLLGASASAASLGYWLVQFLMGGLVFVIFDNINPYVALVISVILFIVYLIVSFTVLAVKESIETQDVNAETKVQFVRTMKAELSGVAALAQDAELKKKISVLAEDAGYSDPISGKELAELEGRIMNNIALLREDVDDGDAAKAAQRVDKIRAMVQERNAKCAILKQH